MLQSTVTLLQLHVTMLQGGWLKLKINYVKYLM